jgi:hypothetical protein
MTFAGALALLAIVRAHERGMARDYLLAGAAIGLSVSFKYNTGLLVLSLVAAHLLARPRPPWGRLLLSLAAVPGVFLLLNPYWVLDFSAYREAFLFQSSHMKAGHPGHLYGPPVVWFVWRALVEEGIVGAALFAGLVVSVFRLSLARPPLGARGRADVLVLAYALPSFLAITTLKNQGLDYCVGLYPALAILAGRALADALGARGGRDEATGDGPIDRRMARGAGARAATAVLLALPALALAASRLVDTHLPDTRTLARAWVEENLPDGTGIGIDGMIYNPQLLRKDRFEGSATGAQFLDSKALESARARLAGRRMYLVVSMSDATAEPVWPEQTPPEVRARHGNEPWARLMFRRRILGAEELLARGARSFFVSSYTTRGFAEGRWYPPDSPVYYVALRDKLGYEKLLADPRVVLVRNWEPGPGARGPRLSLYRLKSGPEDLSVD